MATLLCIVGCGPPPTDVEVRGTVRYQGEPVASAAVTFFPKEGRSIPTPLAEDGTFETRLAPGEYRVTVMQGVQLPAGWQEGDAIPEPDVVLPEKYAHRQRSPLKMTVTNDLTGPIDLELE